MTQSNGQVVYEDQIKARFISRFCHFVDWPESKSEQIRIGILDSPSFFKILKNECNALKGRTPVIDLHLVHDSTEIKSLDILFIPNESRSMVEQFVSVSKTHNILLVGESKGFAEVGGMIEFRIVKNNIRFKINIENLKQAELVISSKLARLAIE